MPIFVTGLDVKNPDKLCVLIGLIAPTQYSFDITGEAIEYWNRLTAVHTNWLYKYPFLQEFKDGKTLCVFAPLDETNNIIDKDEALLTLQKYPIFIPPIEWNKWSDIEANITPCGVTLH
jgi:hypothetical protein